MILCIDLGTQMGWAMDSGTSINSGTLSLASRRFEGGGMRFLRFQKWLDETRGLVDNIKAVYFEEVHRHAGTDAAHIVRALLAYRSGARPNTTMRSVAGALGDEEIAVLAHYLAGAAAP